MPQVRVLLREPNLQKSQNKILAFLIMTMNYRVYILQSKTTGRYYCGHTDDLDRRLRQHNDPDYHGSKTTKRFEGPWVVVWSQEGESRGKAMVLERQIKKRGTQRFPQNMQSIESRHRRD